MKITLDISEEELELLDEMAQRAGVSRDKFVENILEADIERIKKLREAKNLSDKKLEAIS